MTIKKSKTRILVALSGGVDSAVAAALLVKAGYNVMGAYMVNYDDQNGNTEIKKYGNNANVSCWLPDYRDAVRVAAKLGIPLVKLDFIKEYKKMVLDYMFAEYKAGRTPNPDILCNKFIKFGSWLNWARTHGYDFLATGHYARIKKARKQESKKATQLMCAKDKNKDQTYFLNQLTQDQLKFVMFPIGEYTKPEVRKLALKFGLPVANKEESMGICFIGEVPMKEFLETQIKPKPGKIVMSDGTAVGKHDGLAFYTIGQRHIGNIKYQISNIKLDSKPMYVVAKRFKTNELVVGYEDDPLLYSKQISIVDVNWTAGREPKFPLKCMVRLRHRQPLQPAVVKKAKNQKSKKSIVVEFEKAQRAVTPGQFAVFYKAGECLGGGVIK